MTIVANNLHGDYQLANGYRHYHAEEVLRVKSYIVFLNKITCKGILIL